MSMSTSAQANKADHAAKRHHEILVTLQDAVPSGNPELKKEVVPHIPKIMYVGETVNYKSDDGTGQDAGVVTIKFPDHSPYLNPDKSEKKEVTSNDPQLELKVEGIFMGRCYITYKGVEYGWGPYTPRAGGNHVVK
jgi:hypothetical protein